MEPTQRPWTDASLVVVLAMLAIVFARPVVLAGAASIGAWVLARQYQFGADLVRTMQSLTVRQSPARTGLRTGESTPVTLTASLERPAPVALDVEAGVPTGATADDALEVAIEPGDVSGDRTAEVSWPIAGRHRFRRATVTVRDGCFAETISAGGRPAIVVEPRGPRRIHVGAGGEQLAASFGEHESGRRGSGLLFADLREYAPGDTAGRIDWKATARLGTPYVREFEAETDRRTLLVVDHRRELSSGPDRETKLDFLREVALSAADSARRLGDPVGLLTVGDGGVTTRLEPASTPDAYLTIRRQLLGLEPTAASAASPSSTLGPVSTTPRSTPELSSRAASAVAAASSDRHPRHSSHAPFRHADSETRAVGRRAPATLEGGDDPFVEALRPFYEDRPSYRERIDSKPLYRGLRRTLAAQRRTTWTVIFTDDSHPGELRETVGAARAEGHDVMVVLAPTVLYEPAGLVDVERAYDRYVSFEELRRGLARIDRVTALEVGPDDRLGAVLDAGRSRGDRA